jgi:hypothetical protein
MLVLQCKIYIGKYVFNHVNQVKIDSSRTSLSDTAVIRLPQKYKSQYLASEINPGDKVEIWLGYKPVLKKEFEGYITEVKPNIPIEIHSEDEMYQLKRSKPQAKSWTETTLEQVVKYLVPDADIEVPKINFKKFKLDGKGSKAHALQKIKDVYGLDIYFREGVLFAGLAYTDTQAINAGTVNYNLRENVINQQLNYRKVSDVRIKVKAISILEDNTRLEVTTGDEDGALKTIHFYNLTTEGELLTQAEESLKYMKYEGFEGSLMAFGEPYCIHGQVANIIDPKFEARKGNHFIDRVITTFGTEGFRRQVYLGRKAS